MGRPPGVVYGNGRSYGDSCLNPDGLLWDTCRLDHFVGFDQGTGRLVCEAGVLLRDIQRLAIPRGWMLAVTPGTQMVTVGGAIANDVHGKNHHTAGTFGHHLRRLTLARTDGTTVHCGPELNAPLFEATVGGFGMTGVITEAEIQLRPCAGPWISVETLPFGSLNEFFALAEQSDSQWEHTVSWIDCANRALGRGLFMRGRPVDGGPLAPSLRRKLSVPLVPPVSLVNRLSLRPFNSAYFQLGQRAPRIRLAHYEAFFYPLDNIHHWNRMYGPRGFFQYQSVVPTAAGKDATHAMLAEIARSGEGSFLAVLKTFGSMAPAGMMSFPMPGVTLALDFPNRGERTLRLFGRLDNIVRQAGGRIYLAKDARMPRTMFEAGYGRLPEFLKYRDPGISSAMSRRLLGS
jgi:FAD/FMN-containing dehydrogenase